MKTMKKMYTAPKVEIKRVVLEDVITYSPVRMAEVEDWNTVASEPAQDSGDLVLPF
jgi:hypothetical protein